MMEADTIYQEDTKVEVAQPKHYRVILHNDDVTTFQFVIMVLVDIFSKSVQEAMDITTAVHEKGQGIAGLYVHEIAEQKVEETHTLAQEYNFPLKASFEEDS